MNNVNTKYYYNHMNAYQQMIYNSLLSGFIQQSNQIHIPYLSINQLSIIFNNILLDNPMIYYVHRFNQTSGLFKVKCTVVPEYKYVKHVVNNFNDTIKKYLVVFDTVKGKTDIEKELFVHDYCLNNFVYDFSFRDNSFSVLGPVYSNSAVCQGIANFVKLALDYLGVECIVVSGKANNPIMRASMENHAWNIVTIGGKTYHLDVTFDMTIKNNVNRYDYFNLSDDEIRKDHEFSNNIPACIIKDHDYYSLNSMSVISISEYEDFIVKELKKGNKNIIVKIKNLVFTENILQQLMKIAQQKYIDVINKSVTIDIGYNANQMVFELGFK